jgi:tetratricopeptide (TPR) repeat protein
VISAADEILGNPLPPDVVSRFTIIRASAAVTIDRTYGPAALDLVNEHLPAQNWPDAYQRQMIGAALAWTERIDEALHETDAAAEGLNALNCHIEATEARLCAGALRLRLEDPDGALWTFRDALSSAERSINRAHVGFAQAGIGRAVAALGDNDAAVEWLEAASSTLSGLGWQHAEEQIAEDHARIVQEVHRTYLQTAAYETGNRAAPPRGAVISDGAEDWIA